MTIFIVCAVRDRAMDAFMQPFFCQARGIANRSFADEINRKDSPFAGHPEDFDLYELGTYEDSTGSLKSHDRPIQLSVGKDQVRQDT